MDKLDEKILEAYQESILNERRKKFDLGSGHLGHGISVYNRAKEVHGDYEKIAHVDDKRKVTWYIKNPTKEVRDYVNKIVTGKNPSVSTSQRNKKVFREETNKELDEAQKLRFGGYHLRDNILDDITVKEFQTVVDSNIPKDKMTNAVLLKEFNSLLNMRIKDAKHIIKKIIPDMIEELQKGD